MDRLLRSRLLALTIAATSMFPSAEAEASGLVVGGGAYVSWIFGPRHGLGWGLELHGTTLLRGYPVCRNLGPAPVGVGGTLQLGLRRLEAPRLVLAAIAGAGPADPGLIDGVHGELGASIPLGALGAIGPHGGLVLDTPFSHLALRSDLAMEEPVSLGFGPQFPGPMGVPEFCIPGRPPRADDGHAPTGQTRGDPGADPLARAWAEDARLECDSIPAFLGLAAELLALGAPDALVAAALDAVEEEMRHAASAAALASRQAGAPVWPSLPAPPRRSGLPRAAALQRLAVESYLDGVVGEGAAADEAAAAAGAAADRATRDHYAAVSVEERRHAALGAAVLCWSIQEGGEPVRAALSPCLEHTRPPPPAAEALPGRLDGATVTAIGEARSARARAALAAALA